MGSAMKKIFSWFMVCAFVGLLALVVIPEPVSAMTGSGTAGDPYIIYDVTDLQNMNNDLDAYYELANDIDASATSGWNGGAGFIPVGTWGSPFTGYFEGNGYTISSLFINRPSTDDVGLFGSIQPYSSNTFAQNVTFTNADITGDENTGVFAGSARGKILAPVRTLTVSNIIVLNSEVYGAGSTGGVVGELWNVVEMSYCLYVGTVDGDGYKVGGLVGYATRDTMIYRCVADADVDQDGWGSRVGGLVGQGQGDIEECCSFGSVNNIGADPGAADDGIGGLVGLYDPVVQEPADILNCYSRCSVTGKVGTYGESVAGLVGVHVGTYSTITNSFSTGLVSGGLARRGLACGNPSCSACFWDTQTSGQSLGGCGTGKTTSQMKTESTFTDAGWDFDTVWDMGGAVNDGYPYFQWWYNPPSMIEDIYQVVWFQPNAIIQGTVLPNRAEEEDGIITWGANPAGISISHSLLQPEEDYEFEPVIPEATDIIEPEPGGMTGDVDLERLENNPFNPLVQAIVSVGGFTARLVWLGIAWFVLIAVMMAIQLKTHHMMLTGIAGFGLATLFYVMGIFPLWVVIVFGMGMVASIIYERMTVL